MIYTINRLRESDNIRIATINEGFQETLEGDENDIELIFLDYRHFYVDEGGYFWDLVAVDEEGEEFFQEGNEDLKF